MAKKKRATKTRTARGAMRSRRVYLGKGLTRMEAWRKARAKPGRDFRAMTYSASTGYATLL